MAQLIERAPAKKHMPALRGQLALRRSTSAFFNPWGPACLWPGGVRRFRDRDPERRKERALGVIMRREADPRTPGTTIANRGRGRRSPFTLSSPRERPSANRDKSAILMGPGSVKHY
jgi:hypothetical protein